MATNKKPKKKYRGPKYPHGQVPIVFRHSKEADTALQLVPHTEIDKLRDGTADEYMVNTLAFRLNWGYVMAGEYFDTPEARQAMIEVLDAIRSVKERFSRLGKYGCTPLEFQALGAGLNWTDEMQKSATRREQRDALRIVDLVNEDKRKNP